MYWIQSNQNLNNVLSPQDILRDCDRKGISQIIIGNEGPYQWLEFDRLNKKYNIDIIFAIYKRTKKNNILWLLIGDVLENAVLLEEAYEKKDFKKITHKAFIPIIVPKPKLTKTDKKKVKDAFSWLNREVGSVFVGETPENTGAIKELAMTNDKYLLPLQRVRYLEPIDKELTDIRRKINGEKDIVDTFELSLKPQKFLPQKMNKAKKILKDIESNLILKKGKMQLWNLDEIQKMKLPKDWSRFFTRRVQLPVDVVEQQKILLLCTKAGRGFNVLYGRVRNRKEALNRLKYEITTVVDMGFYDYFLVIEDITTHFRKKGVRLGLRGSVNSSVLAHCLRITDVDPLHFNLKFERFINQHRQNRPDIDLEIPATKREEVQNYLIKRYTKELVSKMVTFSSFGMKNSIAYIRKHFNIEENIESWIPKGSGGVENFIGTKLGEETENRFKSGGFGKIYSMAIELSANPQSVSIHQAGIVVNSLLKNLPVTKIQGERVLEIASDNEDLELLGMDKIDFLSSNVLDIIEETWEKVGSTGRNKFNFNDRKTYELLSKGDKRFVFQIRSYGMRQTIEKIQPNTLNDIMDGLALFRPGPKKELEMYIRNKQHKSYSLTNDKGVEMKGVQDLIPVTKETNGVIIYQEQIMDIVRIWAGYTMGESDLLRVIVSSKDINKMNEEKKKFVERSVKNGRERESTLEIYRLISQFAEYGFPKSHAASYARLTYETAYLKANHPVEFFLAQLNQDVKDFNKKEIILKELSRLGISYKNSSLDNFNERSFLKNGVVILGLLSVRGIGQNTVNKIRDAKKKYGYASLLKNLNKVFTKKEIDLLDKISFFKNK